MTYTYNDLGIYIDETIYVNHQCSETLKYDMAIEKLQMDDIDKNANILILGKHDDENLQTTEINYDCIFLYDKCNMSQIKEIQDKYCKFISIELFTDIFNLIVQNSNVMCIINKFNKRYGKITYSKLM